MGKKKKKKEAPARVTEQECKIWKRTEAGGSFRRKTWSAHERYKEVKRVVCVVLS